MHVEAHWRTQDYSQVQLWDTHTYTLSSSSPISLSCSLSRPWCFLFLSLGFGLLCFATFSSVCFIEGPHLTGLGAFLHVQSLSPIANLPRLSVPFYVQVFFSFFPCLLSACFYFSTIKKSPEEGSPARPVMFLSFLKDTVKVFYVMIASNHSFFCNKVWIFDLFATEKIPASFTLRFWPIFLNFFTYLLLFKKLSQS